MASDSLWALQAAVFTALTGDATLQGLIGNPARVYDAVPQDAVFPYAVIGQVSGKPWDTKTSDGMEAVLEVHTWSRYAGMKEAKDIMAAVTAVLDDQALSVAGHTLVNLRFESSQTSLENDGITRHGVQKFRAVTQAP